MGTWSLNVPLENYGRSYEAYTQQQKAYGVSGEELKAQQANWAEEYQRRTQTIPANKQFGREYAKEIAKERAAANINNVTNDLQAAEQQLAQMQSETSNTFKVKDKFKKGTPKTGFKYYLKDVNGNTYEVTHQQYNQAAKGKRFTLNKPITTPLQVTGNGGQGSGNTHQVPGNGGQGSGNTHQVPGNGGQGSGNNTPDKPGLLKRIGNKVKGFWGKVTAFCKANKKALGILGGVVVAGIAIGAAIKGCSNKDTAPAKAEETQSTTSVEPTPETPVEPTPVEPVQPTPVEPEKPAYTPQLPLNDDGTYEIKKGDSYWKIAERNLKDKFAREGKTDAPTNAEIQKECERIMRLNETWYDENHNLPDPMIHAGNKIKIQAEALNTAA